MVQSIVEGHRVADVTHYATLSALYDGVRPNIERLPAFQPLRASIGVGPVMAQLAQLGQSAQPQLLGRPKMAHWAVWWPIGPPMR